LEVWKKAVDFVVNIYRETGTFPSEEKFGLTSQIRRAAVSIPANIAEGAARQSDKEFNHFIAVAQGSCSEVETELLSVHVSAFLHRLFILHCGRRQMLSGVCSLDYQNT
jgi:four helix bundle protein